MYKIFIDKANTSYDVDFAKLPQKSQDRVIEYGLSQLLSDAAASVATTTKVGNSRVTLAGNDLVKAHTAAKALVDQRMADLSAGILRRVRESSADPVESEARKIAIALVNKDKDFLSFLSEKGLKRTDKDATDELQKRVEKQVVRKDIVALATKRVKEMEELAALAA